MGYWWRPATRLLQRRRLLQYAHDTLLLQRRRRWWRCRRAHFYQHRMYVTLFPSRYSRLLLPPPTSGGQTDTNDVGVSPMAGGQDTYEYGYCPYNYHPLCCAALVSSLQQTSMVDYCIG